MKTTEECKVIFIGKNKVSTDPSLNVENKGLANSLFNNIGNSNLEGKSLYLLSDEEIKEGDLVMDFYCSLYTTNPNVYRWTSEDEELSKEQLKQGEFSNFEEMMIFKVVNSTDFSTRTVNVDFVEIYSRVN